jgi:hypothetical protein
MGLLDAEKKFREFHAKNPRKIEVLNIEIPRYVYPIGYGLHISYRSDKWGPDGEFVDYIHWFENKTFVCIGKDKINVVGKVANIKAEYDLGPKRNEVTYLGYALDFGMTKDDRTKIKTEDNNFGISKEEQKKASGSTVIAFNADHKSSRDYVACSPNGNIIYIISELHDLCFAFINNNLNVTSDGIEG